MDTERLLIAGGLAITLLIGGVAIMMLESGESLTSDGPSSMIDPLVQYDEGHDHRNASQHVFYTDNIQPVSFNPLTAPGNAEVQVADSPDGRTYAYLAGWSEMHIVDVTNPANTTVTGVYIDPSGCARRRGVPRRVAANTKTRRRGVERALRGPLDRRQ